MPDISPNQGLSLPNATDNANGPLAFDNYNDGVEPRLVQRYLSSADRTVRNPTPAQGELSYLANLDQFERYSASWKSLRGMDKTVRVILRRSTSFSVPTSSNTTVSWETAELNDYGTAMWNIASPTSILLPEPGCYLVYCGAAYSANSSAFRKIIIGTSGGLIAGIPEIAVPALTSPELTPVAFSTFVYTTTSVGTISIILWQNSGSTLTAASAVPMYVGVFRVG